MPLRATTSSISRRLTVWLLAFSALLALATSAVSLYGEHRERKAFLKQSMEQIGRIQTPALAESLWVMDLPQLSVSLAGLLRTPHIEQLQIESRGTALVTAGSPSSPPSQRIVRVFPLHHVHDGQTIDLGTLRVTAGFEDVSADLREWTYERLALEAAEVFLLALFLLLIVRVSITQRLGSIARHVSTLEYGALDRAIPLRNPQRPDELDRVASAINEMSGSLRQTFQRLETQLEGRVKAEAALEREIEAQKGAAELSAALLSLSPAPSAAAVADLVLGAARAVTHSEHGYVAEIDPVTGDFVGHTLTAMMDEACTVTVPEQRVAFPRALDGRYGSLWGHSLNAGEPFFSNDPQKHAAWTGSAPSGHVPIRQYLSVPVLQAGHVVGQISVANHDEGYNEGHLRAVEQLARLYGIALQQSRTADEKTRLEEQLRQAQKMEAIGTLASGIAHDFNNILSGMMGYTELTALRLDEGTKVHKNLMEVLKLGERARDLVQQILTFSRRGEQFHRPLDLRGVIQETLKLLRASLPSTIEVREDLDAADGTVLADPTQMQQVLMNLCTNAFQAMAQGGILEVRLRAETVDVARAACVPGLHEGAYFVLEVEDTGRGMDAQTLSRIFDPFFTTKGPGEGTGLGLAVVHGILSAHHGAISVKSRPGEGSTFAVFLPRIEASSSALREVGADVPHGTGTVLVVDDEEALAQIAADMLECLGYRATVATSGREALERFRKTPNGFDLVVSDQTMPGMTGSALLRELLALRPDLAVVLCTGYSQGLDDESARKLGARALLLKPLTLRKLAETVERVLSPRTASPEIDPKSGVPS